MILRYKKISKPPYEAIGIINKWPSAKDNKSEKKRRNVEESNLNLLMQRYLQKGSASSDGAGSPTKRTRRNTKDFTMLLMEADEKELKGQRNGNDKEELRMGQNNVFIGSGSALGHMNYFTFSLLFDFGQRIASVFNFYNK